MGSAQSSRRPPFKDFCKPATPVSVRFPSQPLSPSMTTMRKSARQVAQENPEAHRPAGGKASGDFWQVREERGFGDCEDFALTLRKMMRAKYPEAANAFRIATAFTETGEYHAVLSIETDKGTIICDIRYRRCQDWAKHALHLEVPRDRRRTSCGSASTPTAKPRDKNSDWGALLLKDASHEAADGAQNAIRFCVCLPCRNGIRP